MKKFKENLRYYRNDMKIKIHNKYYNTDRYYGKCMNCGAWTSTSNYLNLYDNYFLEQCNCGKDITTWYGLDKVGLTWYNPFSWYFTKKKITSYTRYGSQSLPRELTPTL